MNQILHSFRGTLQSLKNFVVDVDALNALFDLIYYPTPVHVHVNVLYKNKIDKQSMW